jgi:hypothetical protein
MKPMKFDAWLGQVNSSLVDAEMVALDSSGATGSVPLEEVHVCAFILKSMIDRSQEGQPASRLSLAPMDLPMPG